MFLDKSILSAAEASASILLEQLVVTAHVDLAFLYYYHLDHFTLVISRPCEVSRAEVLPHFEKKTGAAAEAYFRQFAAALLHVRADNLGFHLTRSISPAQGFSHGAIGISRRQPADRDAILPETMAAASFLMGHLLKSLGELVRETSSERGSDLSLLRTIDALSLLFSASVVKASIGETTVGRQRLITLVLILLTLTTSSTANEDPLTIAIETADKAVVVELQLASADSAKVRGLISQEAPLLRAVITALKASIGFSAARDGKPSAIVVNVR